MPTTEWLIGSEPLLPESSFTVDVNGNGVQMNVAAGAYYLWDDGSPRDLCEVIGGLVQTHPDITTATAYIGRDRRFHITADVGFTLDWAVGAEVLRDFLGAGPGFEPEATTFIGTSHPVSLWSPGRRGITSSRLGQFGRPVHDTVFGGAPNAPRRGVTHASFRRGDWKWMNVPVSRVWTDEMPGEYFAWWQHTVPRGLRFKIVTGVDELDGNTSPFSWDRLSPPLQLEIDRAEFTYERAIKNVDSRATVDLGRYRSVPEYS